MASAVNAPFDGVLKQLRDVASAIDTCASMTLPDLDMGRMQADSTASILASLERLRTFGVSEQAAFLKELHPLKASYGDTNATRLATKVNDMVKGATAPRGAKGTVRGTTPHGGSQGGSKPQVIMHLLKYLTRRDWD